MSAPYIIISSRPSFCQKLSKLVEICHQSYAKNNYFDCLFWDTVHKQNEKAQKYTLMWMNPLVGRTVSQGLQQCTPRVCSLTNSYCTGTFTQRITKKTLGLSDIWAPPLGRQMYGPMLRHCHVIEINSHIVGINTVIVNKLIRFLKLCAI